MSECVHCTLNSNSWWLEGGGGGLVVGNGEGNNSINLRHFISDVSNPFIIITEQYLLCSFIVQPRTTTF